jgi:hypothetical protein
MTPTPPKPSGPGFIAVFFDVPFSISIPNGGYLTYDPKKGLAHINLALREGSTAFFRNRPIIGPTTFEALRSAAEKYQRPRPDYSYIATSVLPDGTEKATLNVHTGHDGGYSESKFYSEICVTLLDEDVAALGAPVFSRACHILNSFLDKYRLLNQDYRVTPVSHERNFYLAAFHTSPLGPHEVDLEPETLFQILLQHPRDFYSKIGYGASNYLRSNTYEFIGPKGPLSAEMVTVFRSFILEPYELPLFYDLILQALICLQSSRDYRLTIVHAETGFEVYVTDRLSKLMAEAGLSTSAISSTLENDRDYWGIKRRLRRLDEWTEKWSLRASRAFKSFHNSSLYHRWDSDLYKKRNAAVHAGAGAFSYSEAATALGTCKECIADLEKRVPPLADRVRIDPSMKGFRENAGPVLF